MSQDMEVFPVSQTTQKEVLPMLFARAKTFYQALFRLLLVVALDDAVGLLVGLAGGTGITAFFFHNTPILAENRPKEEI